MRARRATILILGICLATVMGAALPARADEQSHAHGDIVAPHSSGAALGTRAQEQAQGQSMTFAVNSLNQSGIVGTAKLTPVEANKVEVEVTVNGAGAEARPMHIHKGACADLNPLPDIPLTTVTNGSSTTEVDAPMQQLISTPHAIFLHKSPIELPIFVACADIMVATRVATIPATGEGDSYAEAAAALFGFGSALVAAGWFLRRLGLRAWASRARIR
jgi:hypothetical protein